MGDVIQFRVSTVHVEDLIRAVNRYNSKIRGAAAPTQRDAAKSALRQFCEDHRLPVSFAERDYTLTKET